MYTKLGGSVNDHTSNDQDRAERRAQSVNPLSVEKQAMGDG